MWKTIITRNTGTQETRGDEDYKLKPKQNHCYGHTPQIQKGAKTSNSGVERNVIRYSGTQEKKKKINCSNHAYLLCNRATLHITVHISSLNNHPPQNFGHLCAKLQSNDMDQF